MVTQVEPLSEGFRLRFEDGETVAASRVVVAAGINYFRHVPESLAALPAEYLSHSSQHHDLGGFKGRRVAVIGAGASAIDLAGLLADAGAEVELIVRRTKIDWLDPPSARERSLWERIRYPESGLSPGLRSRFYEDLPMFFRHLPERTRLQIVDSFLGPAPPAWMKDRIIGRMPVRLRCELVGAAVRQDRVSVRLRERDGAEEQELVADHVIAATGFRIDLRRLPFLDSATVERTRKVAGAPALSADFEASVPGLYFAGVTAANTFGPVMRFMLGANYTARRLSRHLVGFRARRFGSNRVVQVDPAQA
jgi:thioredoxin reductase